MREEKRERGLCLLGNQVSRLQREAQRIREFGRL